MVEHMISFSKTFFKVDLVRVFSKNAQIKVLGEKILKASWKEGLRDFCT